MIEPIIEVGVLVSDEAIEGEAVYFMDRELAEKYHSNARRVVVIDEETARELINQINLIGWGPGAGDKVGNITEQILAVLKK